MNLLTYCPPARLFACAVALYLIATSSGCHLLKRRPQLEPTPIVFQQLPSLEQLALAVNGNSERVETVQSRDARLSLQGLPAVSVEITYEQPRRLRMRASSPFTGALLDLGSNDELFWFWARPNPQPALFYARHDQFAASANRALIPVEPLWIIDAMGLPRFDPSHRHEGPVARGKGELEIRSWIPTPDGENTKITLINQQYAWVIQQQVYDARGRLLAKATASDHEYFPHAQAALPRKVAIELPAAGLSFSVESQSYAVNLPLDDAQSLFTLPRDDFADTPLVDLADPRFTPPTAPSETPAYPGTSEAPRLRGLR